MTNPFTSETYANIWAEHYCKDKLIVAFETIKGSNFLNISVELFVDYAKVYQVYCIENLMAEEQIALEKETTE